MIEGEQEILLDLFDDYFRQGLSLTLDQTQVDKESPIKFAITKPVFKYKEI